MKTCWEILGIEKTDDKFEIKRAYAKLAHTISPEDDPDGFRLLHAAYQKALMYADHMEEQEAFNLGVKDDDRTFGTRAQKDTQSEDGYDFSCVVEEEFSDDVELILASISNFRTNQGIDTDANVRRWNYSTLTLFTNALLQMYEALYAATDDTSIWHAFFDEPLIRHMLYDHKFRILLKSHFPDETDVGKTVTEYCKRQENETKVIEEAGHEKLSAIEKNNRRKTVWLALSIGSFAAWFIGLFILVSDFINAGIICGIGLLLLEFLTFSFGNYRLAVHWSFEKAVTNEGIGALFVRNLVAVAINFFYVFAVTLLLVQRETLDIGNISLRAAFALTGITGAIAMCIQYKKLRK